MRRSRIVLACSLLPAALAAQAPRVSKDRPAAAARGATESGAFVLTLGRDTTAVERWTRATDASGTRVEGDVVNRSPSVRVTHYVMQLDAQGRPTQATLASRDAEGKPLPNTALGVTITFRGDSAIAAVQRPESTVTMRAGGVPAGTIASIGNSYAGWETTLRAMRAAGRDSGAISLWAPGAPRAQAISVRFVGRDRAQVDYFGDPLMLTVDREGRLLAIDGSRTTNKITATRLRDADVLALARSFAARPAMGQASPRDTARGTIGGAQVSVDYGRPSVRGRTVWGGELVPYNQIWRTGANAATQLTLSAPLTIGGTAVPAGTYTLFTWATPQGYQLVINKQTGQWGTEYHAEQDLARVPLAASPLAQPVERFTIAVEPNALVLRWGSQQLAVPVAAR